MRPATKWSDSEIGTLKRAYRRLTCAAIGERLNRTVSSVAGKALRLGMARRRFRWTREAVAAEAKRYQTRLAFQRGCQAAYQSGRRNGWLDEACAHMTPPWNGTRKP